MFLLVNMMFIFILIFESKDGGETEDINVEEDILPNESHEEMMQVKFAVFCTQNLLVFLLRKQDVIFQSNGCGEMENCNKNDDCSPDGSNTEIDVSNISCFCK